MDRSRSLPVDVQSLLATEQDTLGGRGPSHERNLLKTDFYTSWEFKSPLAVISWEWYADFETGTAGRVM